MVPSRHRHRALAGDLGQIERRPPGIGGRLGPALEARRRPRPPSGAPAAAPPRPTRRRGPRAKNRRGDRQHQRHQPQRPGVAAGEPQVGRAPAAPSPPAAASAPDARPRPPARRDRRGPSAGRVAQRRQRPPGQRRVEPRPGRRFARPAEPPDTADQQRQQPQRRPRPPAPRNCTRVAISASPKASAAQSAASAEPSGQNARVNDSSAIAARLRRITRASGSAPRPARRSSVIRSAFPVPPRSLLEPQGACPIQSGMVSRFSISSKLGRARTTSK